MRECESAIAYGRDRKRRIRKLCVRLRTRTRRFNDAATNTLSLRASGFVVSRCGDDDDDDDARRGGAQRCDEAPRGATVTVSDVASCCVFRCVEYPCTSTTTTTIIRIVCNAYILLRTAINTPLPPPPLAPPMPPYRVPRAVEPRSIQTE